MSAMFALCLWSAPAKATPVTIPYEFVRDESTLRLEGVWGMPTYSIEGTFSLSFDLDLGIASFDQVNATLSGEVVYYESDVTGASWTNSLEVLFKLTELESVYVSDTKIDFYLDRNLWRYPDFDIRLSITFVDGSLNMTGHFSAPVPDGPGYYLNAVVVPEPATFFLLALGGLVVRKRIYQYHL
jgi:hypothetical protein